LIGHAVGDGRDDGLIGIEWKDEDVDREAFVVGAERRKDSTGSALKSLR
jgi:hypothetical protein